MSTSTKWLIAALAAWLIYILSQAYFNYLTLKRLDSLEKELKELKAGHAEKPASPVGTGGSGT